MRKEMKHILAAILATILVVSCGFVPAAATDADSEQEKAVLAQESASAGEVTPEVRENETVSILQEDITLRGEYEKHYLMSDGSYQAVVYSEPVHELVDGAWVEITSTNQNARDSATTDNTKSNIIDNYVLQGGGVQNKSLDRLYIGNRSARLTRAFIQFATMPTIPEGSTITSATMTLHLTSGTSTAANASAYMVTGGEWASGTIQWSNMPAANVLLQGDISHNNVTGYTFSCLSAVQTWYNGDPTGQHNNYGIMLKYANESVDDYNAVYSADYTVASKRPQLTINYVRSTGIISDGIYYIKSNIGLFLGTYGGTTENTSVKLFAQATSGLAQVRQLWKVTYLGGNYYSIRPLHKINMGLHVTSNSVDITTTAGPEDSLTEVTLQNRWGIEEVSDGKYYINNAGTSSMAMTYPNGAITSGMSVITGTNDGATDSFEWEFVPVDDTQVGVVLYHTASYTAVVNPTKYISEGEVLTLADYSLSPMVYSGAGLYSATMQWTHTGTAVDVEANTGAVTGLTYSDATSVVSGTCDYGSVQFTVKYTEIKEGTYFFQNMETEQYADVSIDDFGSGTAIMRRDFRGANTQRWVLDHLGDGTYSVRIGEPGTSYYLGVQGDSTSNGAVVMLRTGPITDGMRWKFEPVVSGLYYKIVPASGQLANMALTAGENCLQQMQYDNASYSNKWTIHKHKDYALMYIGFMEGEEAIQPVLEEVNTAMIEDAGMEGYAATSMNKADLKRHMSSSRIFSCVTHGLQNSIEASDGLLTISDVNAMSDDAFDDLKLVYLGCCETGKGGAGADNLVNALYDKGADVVIGFRIEVNVDQTYVWTEAFMKSIALGNTIEDALEDADYVLDNDDTIPDYNVYTVSEINRHIRGSINLIPCS